jgi:hypothetical protein
LPKRSVVEALKPRNHSFLAWLKMWIANGIELLISHYQKQALRTSLSVLISVKDGEENAEQKGLPIPRVAWHTPTVATR